MFQKSKNKMEQCKTLERVVGFYEFRKDCKCESLNHLWERIKSLDGLETKCSEYGDDYLENPGKKDDVIFMSAFRNNVERFKEELQNYAEVFADLCLKGDIEIKTYKEKGLKKVPVSLKKAYYMSLISKKATHNISYEFYCSNCKTRIPKIKYPDWGF